ncbi:DinB family protein [Ureibacillus thermosphaericus]|uniref:DinB family protein n=1 Tax=Ureibacillus thermosphaericus TaxID=51173 RepID=UPI000BBC4BCC|nr:DinB family protein [Ureibacillus thermosphaericus]
MYRKIDDFIKDWQHNSAGTIAIMESITEDKKHVAIVEGHNSLEFLSWHLTNAPLFFCGLIGQSLNVQINPSTPPTTMKEIIDEYKKVNEEVVNAVKKLDDSSLEKEVDMIGQPTAIGAVLRMLIDHQTHHRAQMQVLLRQAGLPVPGVMGPTKEQSNA